METLFLLHQDNLQAQAAALYAKGNDIVYDAAYPPTIETHRHRMEAVALNHHRHIMAGFSLHKEFDMKKYEERKRFVDRFISVDFLRRHIFPLAERMDSTPEGFLHVCEAALASIIQFLEGNVSGKLPDQKLLHEFIPAFFEYDHITEPAEGCEKFDRGQFRHCMEEYQGSATLAIAYLQGGRESDPIRSEEIDIIWGVMKNDPDDSEFFLGCVSNSALNQKNPRNATTIVNEVPLILGALHSQGKSKFFRAYLGLLSGIHEINYDEDDEPSCPQFPIFKGLEITREFEALEKAITNNTHFHAILELGREILDTGLTITFIHGEPNPHQVNVGNIYNRLVEAGCDDSDIMNAMALPFANQKHRRRAIRVSQNYHQINTNFPGGAQAFLDYADEVHYYISHQPRILNRLLKTFAGGESAELCGQREVDLEGEDFDKIPCADLPEKNLEIYLEVGKGVFSYLRDQGEPYLDAVKRNPRLITLLGEEPKQFEAVICEAKNCAFQFHVLGSSSVTRCAARVFQAYLEHWGDPQFDQLINALDILHQQATRMIEEKTNDDDENFSEQFALEKEIIAFLNTHAATIPLGKIPFERIAMESCFLSVLRQKAMYASDESLEEHILNHLHEEDLSWPFVFGPYAEEALKEILQTEVKFLTESEADEDSVVPVSEVFGVISETIYRVRGIGVGMPTRESVIAPISWAEVIGRLNNYQGYLEQMLDAEGAIGTVSKHLHEQLKQALRLASWKDNLGLVREGPSILRASEDGLHPDSWLRKANPATQMAATSAALMVSLGLDKAMEKVFPEFKQYIPEGHIVPLPLTMEGNISSLIRAVEERGLGERLQANMARIMPIIADAIQCERTKMLGLFPVGAKTQTLKSVDPREVRFVLDLAGLGNVRNTPFTLKHSGKSLVQPPLPSAFEAKMLHMMFQLFGVVDEKSPDLQVAIAGRWNNKLASIVGASLILASSTYIDYKDGAWETAGHDALTGARMMVYDYGVLTRRMPYQFEGIVGRTDISGRKDLKDFDWTQVLGTFATHKQFNGPLAKFMEVYSYHFTRLLQEHEYEGENLFDVIQQSRWIYSMGEAYDAVEHHEAMIRAVAEAGRQNPELEQRVREMIQGQLITPLQKGQPKIRAATPEEVAYLEHY